MTSDVLVSSPVRTRVKVLEPADFDDIAACESVEWVDGGVKVAGGVIRVRFKADLTDAQRRAVVLRCITTDAGEEATLTAAAKAYSTNEAYLSATTTAAQDKAQVAALTRQVQGLIRYVTRSGG